ncbi:molybdopterin-dependent oxidoreductase [Shewanella avicenniae]|uniref:Molybdopterin-dependent oxidoreductase n=1 Tax=Shewanella avicenniae TaxID=2814294 RepID=A0ABX7QLP3_9GAMM|nr:molybdopterin-dependent oxidoreductase [Shewanella avicenniae]QSX32371.1 molybdopterin-dependent oxidoreductase [Shewanella avicenniae]
MKQIQTNCAYCGVGCGISVSAAAQTGVAVSPSICTLKGDADHPANFGHLCQKGERLLDTLPLPHALRYPRLANAAATLSWDDATDLVAEKFASTIAQYGADSVAFYLSGQLLTEDYYVANKLAKGFWGTANVDTNSRLCMSSAVSAHIRAFGEDVVPGCYQDFELADVVVLVGANTAWTHPVLFQRILRARESHGTKLVVIDPRRTATARQADLHLAISPDSDLWLFSLLFKKLHQSSAVNPAYLEAHTDGLTNALTNLDNWLAADSDVLAYCGISQLQFDQLLALYRDHKAVLTASCMGVNQSIHGTDTTNAIINCHLLNGDIGKPGRGFFSLTGQPNAMGGREVGGLATQLANHLGFAEDERALVADFWGSDNIATHAGVSALDMFQAMADGKIKAVWIMATNPLASLPDSTLVQKALETCPFVVVSDISSDTDTARMADLLLPAQGWSEKSGTTTNCERRITRQRAFITSKGEAKADWWMVAEVAKKMGYAGFDYASAADIFREFAALSAKVKQAYPHKQLDLAKFAELSDADYDALKPQQWPLSADRNPRVYSYGEFSFTDGRARFVTPALVDTHYTAEQLLLISGRSRDQWHTRTRTGHVAQLVSHEQQPCVYAHSSTISALQLVEGQMVALTSPVGGELLLQLMADDALQANQLFMAMHWTGRETGSFSVNQLLDTRRDPVSKQPAFKGQPVTITSRNDIWQGIEWGDVSAIDRVLYRFTQVLSDSHCQHVALQQQYLPQTINGLKWQIGQVDIHCELANGRISAIRLLSPLRVAVDKDAVAKLIGQVATAQLLGKLEQLVRAGDSPLVCVCKGVTREQIITVAHSFTGKCRIEGVQQLTGCSTGCGSCRGELISILETEFSDAAAAVVTLGGAHNA